MIEAIAIDDEPAALEVIRLHAEDIPFLTLKAAFTNPMEAIDYLNDHSVDLLFLDINMPKLSGFQLWNVLGREYPVIFTTAYAEYATRAFDFEAIDYLMKPIAFERFLKACSRASKSIPVPGTPDNVDTSQNSLNHIFVRCDGSWQKVHFQNLLYTMSDGNYVKFVMESETIMARYKLLQVIGLLPKDRFIQTHRRYIVNRSKVDQFTHESIVVKGEELPLGRSFQKEVFKAFQEGL